MNATTNSPAAAGRQIWFLTGSQGLYGPEVVDQVSAHSQQIAGALEAGKDIGAEVVWKPVLTSSDGIRRVMLEANADDACLGVICWMHTFSPAKMWIAGLEALSKPLAAPAHAGQRGTSVVRDRHGLHESQPGRAR